MTLQSSRKLSALVPLLFLIVLVANVAMAKTTMTTVTPVPQVVTAAVTEMLIMFQNRSVAKQSSIIRWSSSALAAARHMLPARALTGVLRAARPSRPRDSATSRTAPSVNVTGSGMRTTPSLKQKCCHADPLMKVKGHKDVALEFYSLIKIFESVNIQQKELKVTEGAKEGVYQADLENHQTYVARKQGFFSKHLMPDKVELDVRLCQTTVTTKLEVQKDSGKILSHVEVWHDKFVPVPGFLKPVNGGLSALWFKMLGWGKDVSDSNPTAHGQSATE